MLSLTFSLLLAIGSAPSASPSAYGGDAVFSAATLNSLLGEQGCTGIRFYNVVLDRSDARPTFMAIAHRADGSDINEGLFAHPYQVCAPQERDPAHVSALSRGAAADACANAVASGSVSYSTSVAASDARALLALPGCGGIRVLIAEGTTDRLILVAVSISDGVATDLGRDAGNERNCGEPCPIACGPPANYINAAHLLLK